VNSFGSVLFSDGMELGKRSQGFPKIIKCIKCKKYYWLNDNNKLGEYNKYDKNINSEWKKATEAQFLSLNQYIEAVDSQTFNNKEEECYLRIRLWWKFNDRIRNRKNNNVLFRNNKDKIIYESNCIRLIEIFDEGSKEKIMKAEAFRNLENFIECNNILETIIEENYIWIKDLIKKECERKNKFVIQLIKQ
jgi:hypothetical protein